VALTVQLSCGFKVSETVVELILFLFGISCAYMPYLGGTTHWSLYHLFPTLNGKEYVLYVPKILTVLITLVRNLANNFKNQLFFNETSCAG